MYKCYIDYLTYCLTFIHVQVHWRLEETVFLYQHACNNIVCNKWRGIFFQKKNNVESMWEIQKGFIIHNKILKSKLRKKKIKHWQSSCIIHKILTTFFFAVNKDDMDITTTNTYVISMTFIFVLIIWCILKMVVLFHTKQNWIKETSNIEHVNYNTEGVIILQRE